jgi:DNA-binding PadR family transcriptional regulator
MIGVPAMAALAVCGCKTRYHGCGAQEGTMGPGFGPEKFMRHMHGPGARFFERGGIKFAILELLNEKPRHGYEIIREMEERSGGFYSPSPGAVYPTLQALEDQDLVSSTTEEGKKVYSVTEAGLAYLEEHKEQAKSHRDRWAAHWGPGPHGEGWSAMSEMKETFGDVMRAVRKSAGDPDKMKEIRDVLREAAKKVGDIAGR